jgi:tetratricopeptide (TPR) repeat protein
MITRDVSGCPDLETIAAYLDDRLGTRDRGTVTEHLSSCESCYFVFSEATQVKQSTIVPWWNRKQVIWPTAAAALATAATVVLVVNLGPMSEATDPPELKTLVAAVGTERTIEPRLAGGFAHAPVHTVRSSSNTTSNLPPDTRIVLAQIEKDTANATKPVELRLRGMASLLGGNADMAIKALDEAVRLRPDDARVLNDLGAAYLVRGYRTGNKDDLSNALAAVNRALNADRSLAEAWFNRAYALERLGLTDEAREAWQAYLTIDDRSGWADEARTHLRGLEKQP